MNQEISQWLFTSIQCVVFLIPVITLFYKQGKKDQKMYELERDVDGIGKKVHDVRQTQHETMADVKSKMADMDRSLVEVSVTMRLMSEAIKEMKEKLL